MRDAMPDIAPSVSGSVVTLSEGQGKWFTRLARRRRRSGETPTRKTAIQNHCRECMGFAGDGCTLAEEVRQCTAVDCWLFPWRNGALDPKATA